jgi:hypothetical protein
VFRAWDSWSHQKLFIKARAQMILMISRWRYYGMECWKQHVNYWTAGMPREQAVMGAMTVHWKLR